ncbi:MAG: type III pantothenate kinase [Rikenellaceae bacterium]
MRSLIIDEGNTLIKLLIVSSIGNIDKRCCVSELNVTIVKEFLLNERINSAIYCSVREKSGEVVEYLAENIKNFINFDHSTALPIKNSYSTPQTVGLDRLAAAVGAAELFKEANILVIDFGSAITIDFVERGFGGEIATFRGGNISLGAALRFKSLNAFTRKLPLCSLSDKETSLTATSTKNAIESGVILGIVYEIDGYIREYSEKYNDLKIIFTGGDAKYFGNKFKMTIFADCEIVTKGLYKILCNAVG